MKKIISLFLALLLTVLFCVPLNAEEADLRFSLSDAEGFAGDEIVISLTLDKEKNTGYCAFWLLVYFEDDVFSLENDGISFGKEFEKYGEFMNSDVKMLSALKSRNTASVIDALSKSGVDINSTCGMIIYYEGDALYDNVFASGKAAELRLGIKEGVSAGDYEISLCTKNTMNIDVDLNDLSVSFENSEVKVCGDSVFCDVNGDGDVDMKDVLILRRFLASVIDESDIVLRNADANGDGDIDMKDILYIRLYLSGKEF